MSEFKVGDKVRVIETGLGAPYGEQFVITGIVQSDYASHPEGYAEGDRNKAGVWLKYLELVEAALVLEVGSRVRLEDGTVGIIEEVLPDPVPVQVPTKRGAVVGWDTGLPQYILMHDDPATDDSWSPWRYVETGDVVQSSVIRSNLEDGLVVLWEGCDA